MLKRIVTISISVGALVSLGIIAYKLYKYDDGSNNNDSSNNDSENKNNSSSNNNDSNNNDNINSSNNNHNSRNKDSSNNSNNNDIDEEVEKESINQLFEESVEKHQLEQQIDSTEVEAPQPSEPTQFEPEKPLEPSEPSEPSEPQQSLEPQQVEEENSLGPKQLEPQQTLKPQQSLPQQQSEPVQPLKPETQSEPEQHLEDFEQLSWKVLFDKVKRREWMKSEIKKLEETLCYSSSSIHLSEDDKFRIKIFEEFSSFTIVLIQDMYAWEVKNNKKFIWNDRPYSEIITQECLNLNFKLHNLVYSIQDTE